MSSTSKKPVDQRRAEILEITCQVVVDRGFAATRVQDVARQLGVSTGLIHYHFDNKEALLTAAFQHAAQRDLERLDDQLASVDGAIPKLLRLIDAYSPNRTEAGWLLWVDGWGAALRSPAFRQIGHELDLAWKQRLEATIVSGVVDGTFTCADPRGSAWRLAALLDGLAVQVVVHHEAVTLGELRAWVLHAASWELGVEPEVFGSWARRRRSRR